MIRPAWDGKGLPLADSVCELRTVSPTSDWARAHIKFASRNVVVWEWEGDPAVNGLCTAYAHAVELRPIPNVLPGREQAVIEIGHILIGNRKPCTEYHQAGLIFDAGYRKAPGYAELVAFADWVTAKAGLRFGGQPELVDKAQAALAASRGEA